MKKQLALLTLLSTGPALFAAERNVRYSAAAFGLDNNELLYVEKHVETLRAGRLAERTVRYEDPDGELIAKKLVRYGGSSFAPSFSMTDFRIGLLEGAEVEASQIVLFSGPVGEENPGRALKRPEAAVVDAGFDAFMRENFAEIAEGRNLEFDFAVPAVQRFFKFRLVPKGEIDYGGERALQVSMKPANRLLRLLVDPINLVYDLDGRLLEFRGLSNLCDEQGERYLARIVFDYRDGQNAPELDGLEVAPAL